MGMTFKEMVSDLQSRLGDIGQKDYTLAELKRWINAAQQDVAVRIDNITQNWFGKTSTIPTQADTEEYELPTDVRRIRRVTIKYALTGEPAQGQQIDVAKLGALVTNSYYMPSETTPFWWHWGTKIGVAPKPSVAVTDGIKLWYFKRLPNMVNDDDVTEIPDEHEELIIMKAQITALQKRQQDTAGFEAQYERAFQAIAATWQSTTELQLAGEKKISGQVA